MRDSVDDVDNSMVTWEAPEEVEDLKPGKKKKRKKNFSVNHNTCIWIFEGQNFGKIITIFLVIGKLEGTHTHTHVHVLYKCT